MINGALNDGDEYREEDLQTNDGNDDVVPPL